MHNVCTCGDWSHRSILSSCQLLLTCLNVSIWRQKERRETQTERGLMKQTQRMTTRVARCKKTQKTMWKRGSVREMEKRDVSFIYPHASVLLVKEGEDMRALSPNLLPMSLCFSIDFLKSGIIFQLSFIPFLSLPCPSLSLSLSLGPSSSHISAHTLPLYPHRCLKRVLESHGCADTTYSAHEDVRETRIKKCIK